MPVNIDIKIEDKEVKELLSRIQTKAKNLRPVMSIIGEIVQTSIQRNFEAGGRPKKWKPLSPATIARRKEQGRWPGKILAIRGGLFRSITYQAKNDRVEIGANIKYAALHHFGAKKGKFGTVTAQVKSHIRQLKTGKTSSVSAHTRQTKIPWGNIPARPFMMVHDEDWKEIKDSLRDYIVGP